MLKFVFWDLTALIIKKIETLKKILKALELNNFSVNDLSFLAGDASDRVFSSEITKKEFVIMVDKNRDNLNQFLKTLKP